MQHIQATWYTPANRSPSDIWWIILHCMVLDDKPTIAEGLARYMSKPKTEIRKASAHVAVDQDSAVSMVRDKDVAYGAAGANAHGKHYEQAGFAEQSPAEWLDPASSATIIRTAGLVADDIRAGIGAATWLGVEDLRLGKRGISDHATVEKAFPSTGHHDPGLYYPRDWFMQLVREDLGLVPSTPEEALMGARQIPGTTLLKNGRATFLDVKPDGTVGVYNDVSALGGAKSVYWKGDMKSKGWVHSGIIGWEFLTNASGVYYGYILYASDGGTFIFK